MAGRKTQRRQKAVPATPKRQFSVWEVEKLFGIKARCLCAEGEETACTFDECPRRNAKGK